MFKSYDLAVAVGSTTIVHIRKSEVAAVYSDPMFSGCIISLKSGETITIKADITDVMSDLQYE